MTLLQFVDKYSGKKIGYPNQAFLGECLSLVKQYITETFGFYAPASGNGCAYGYFTNFPQPLPKYFERKDNEPGKLPSPGDIMVWAENVPGVTGKCGHISIFVEGNLENFKSFDQNSPAGTPCKITSHTYKGVLGWLHPKGGEEVVTKEDLNKLYELAFYRRPDPAGEEYYTGKPLSFVLSSMVNSQEQAKFRKLIEAVRKFF